MPTIADISTTADVVVLILEHTHVTDGLRFARVSTVWRDASHAVCGIARMLGEPSRPIRCDGRPRRFEYIWSVCQLPRGNICLVDYRQVRLVSPEPTDYNMLVSPVHEMPSPTPIPSVDDVPQFAGLPSFIPFHGGYLMAAAASGDALFVTYHHPDRPAIFKFSLLPPYDLIAEWPLMFDTMPVDVEVAFGRVYLCHAGGESMDPEVRVFDEVHLNQLFTFGKGNDGRPHEDVGGTPSPEGELSGPNNVVAHDGIYVVESLARRVSVFDYDGNFQRVILCNGEKFAHPIAVAFARDRMVVCDYIEAERSRFRSGTEFVRDFSQLKVLTMDGVLLQIVDLGHVLDVSLSVDNAKGCLYAASNIVINPGTFDQREWAEARLQIIPVWRADPTARKRQQYAQLLLELEKTKNELRAVRSDKLERLKAKNRRLSLEIQAVQEHMTRLSIE